MATTRASLLLSLKGRSNTEAWSEFHKLYAPLLYRYARGRGLSRDDAEEVRDRCLEVVTRKMPTFEYDKAKGGFKNWLRRVADHRVVDFCRKRRERKADTEEIRSLRDAGPSPAEIWSNPGGTNISNTVSRKPAAMCRSGTSGSSRCSCWTTARW